MGDHYDDDNKYEKYEYDRMLDSYLSEMLAHLNN